MPFLLRLRSPPSDLLNMTCTSGGPRTHAVISKCTISNKASQALTYDQTLVCEDAVNAEVLLRFARNELLERAQQTDRRVTALVDEEYALSSPSHALMKWTNAEITRWRYTIRQTKNGDYNVQVRGKPDDWNVDRLIIGSGVLLGMSRPVREPEFERECRPSETRCPQPCYQYSRTNACRPERMMVPYVFLLPLDDEPECIH